MSRSIVISATTATLALHFVWEMVQARAFAPQSADFLAGTLSCFQAALGDVAIAAATFALTAALFGRWTWPLDRAWRRPAVVWLAVGVALTVGLERWALATGRWEYNDAMPLVFGIGLWPILQWIVIPLLTLAIVRTRFKTRG